MGDAVVLFAVAHAGIMAFSVVTRVGQSVQPDGISEVICATMMRTFGLTMRSLFTIVRYAFRMLAGAMLFQTSLVPKCISTMSAGRPSSQVARSRESDTKGSLGSAPAGRMPEPAVLRMSVTM